MTARPLHFGNTPVPYTVSWSGEEKFFIAPCPHAKLLAISQDVAPGVGRPRFGKPHSQRQRETIARELCDICGRPLRNRTKVSLSHARLMNHGAAGPAILQVEPLLHRECAALSMKYCPSLRRDIAAGTLRIRQVNRFRVQFAIMSPIYVATYVPGYVAKLDERIVGHAKVELVEWIDRDEAWLA